MAEALIDHEGGAPVSGFLHRAEGPDSNSAGQKPDAPGFLVLTHGAGGNCQAPLLVTLADAFAAAGLTTLRCDLPFRQRRPTGPPSPADAKRDQEGLRRAVSLMRKNFAGPAFLSGVSYGGRQASLLAADDPSLVEGLLLLSYPLHPPGRPAQLRTAHLPSLQIPTLFISGTSDPFGSVEELTAAIKLIPAPAKLVSIAGAGHGLLQKSNRKELPGKVVQEFRSFFENPENVSISSVTPITPPR